MYRTIAGMILCVLVVAFPTYADLEVVPTDSEVQSVLNQPLSSAEILRNRVEEYLNEMPKDVAESVEKILTFDFDSELFGQGITELAVESPRGKVYLTWLAIGKGDGMGCITIFVFRPVKKREDLGFFIAKCSVNPGYDFDKPPLKDVAWSNPRYSNDEFLKKYFEKIQAEF